MAYRVLADLIVGVHFAWILFMLWGFAGTLYSVIWLYVLRRRSLFGVRFLNRWIFRTIHLAGILFVALLAAAGKYCPLTVWEYQLRLRVDPTLEYPGAFIASWIERLVYPDVPPLAIGIPTAMIAVISFLAYVFWPPKQIRSFFGRGRGPS